MGAMTDPRAAVEFRLPAVQLKVGDLVNTTPGEDDWQEVVGVYRSESDALSTEIRSLVGALHGRYVVVQLTDLAPVDEDGDQPVTEVVSTTDGLRTYLYTKYELVSVRSV
jgi:hypothetical protein